MVILREGAVSSGQLLSVADQVEKDIYLQEGNGS